MTAVQLQGHSLRGPRELMKYHGGAHTWQPPPQGATQQGVEPTTRRQELGLVCNLHTRGLSSPCTLRDFLAGVLRTNCRADQKPLSSPHHLLGEVGGPVTVTFVCREVVVSGGRDVRAPALPQAAVRYLLP